MPQDIWRIAGIWADLLDSPSTPPFRNLFRKENNRTYLVHVQTQTLANQSPSLFPSMWLHGNVNTHSIAVQGSITTEEELLLDRCSKCWLKNAEELQQNRSQAVDICPSRGWRVCSHTVSLIICVCKIEKASVSYAVERNRPEIVLISKCT